MYTFNIHIVFFGAGLALLMSIAHLSARKNLRFAGIGFIMGMIQLRIGFFLAGLSAFSPWLSLYHFTFIFLVGPMSYALTLRMLDFVYNEGKLLRWHFAPALFVAAAETGLMAFRYLPWDVSTFRADFIRFGVLFGTAHSVVYLLYLIHLYLRLQRSYSIEYARPALIMFLAPVVGALVMLIGFFTKSKALMHGAADVYTLAIVLAFFYSVHYPNFFATLREELQKKRYEHTRLDGIDLEKIQEQLTELMEKQKVYLDPDLRLSMLADELNISPHQLSRILNESYRMNFNEFINMFRIKEASRLLTDQPQRTVISIAFEVGFNTKSAFNKQFLKFTGSTPAVFRKNSDAR